KVLPDCLRKSEDVDLTHLFFQPSPVANLAPGITGGFGFRHSTLNVELFTHFKVELQFLIQVVGEFLPVEESPYSLPPTHSCLSSFTGCEIQNLRYRISQLHPFRFFLYQLLASCRGQPVVASASIAFGRPPLGHNPSFLLHAVKCWI